MPNYYTCVRAIALSKGRLRTTEPTMDHAGQLATSIECTRLVLPDEDWDLVTVATLMYRGRDMMPVGYEYEVSITGRTVTTMRCLATTPEQVDFGMLADCGYDLRKAAAWDIELLDPYAEPFN